MSETTTTRTIGGGEFVRTVTEVTIEGHVFLTDGGRFFIECGRCDRACGYLRAFANVYGGVCFECNGTGSARSYGSLAEVTRLAKRRNSDAARADRKRAALEAAAAAAHAEWVAANADLAARLAVLSDAADYSKPGLTNEEYKAVVEVMDTYGDFIVSLAHQSVCSSLTEKQTEAVIEALAKVAEKAEAKATKQAAQHHLAAEEGAKVIVTGTVVVAMNVDGYSYGSTDRLLVIEGTGDFAGCTFKISGSGKTLWDADRGAEVEVTATVKKFTECNGTPQTILTRAKIAGVACTPEQESRPLVTPRAPRARVA